jgi:UDP-glucose:(heptosyl)LPS alpha-1,3-glucosyltransferase
VDIYTGEWQGDKPNDIGVIEFDTKAATNHRSNDLLAQRFAEAVAGKGYDCRVGFTKLPGLDVYYAADPCYAARVEETKHPLYKLLPRYRAFCRQEASVFKPGVTTELMLIAHQEQAKFIKHYGTEQDRFHLLPPGINRERLMSANSQQERKHIREEFGIDDNEMLLLAVGSRFRTKGIDRAIQALAALPDALKMKSKLVVVGHGKAEPLKRLAVRLQIADKVIFTGTREDVNRFYRAADYLIHAPRSENTGTVLIEAMICGLPVLVTENCGFAKHVAVANAGITVPEPFEQKQLDSTLREFLQSDSRDDWMANGPNYCENTDLYSLIERAADVIVERAERNSA